MTDFFLSFEGITLLNFAAEFAVVFFFFAPLENRSEGRRWLGLLCLASVSVIYFWPSNFADASSVTYANANLLNPLLRLAVYWAAVSGYLWFRKVLRPSAALYLAAFYICFYSGAGTLRGALNAFRLGVSLSPRSSQIFQLWINVTVLLFEFLMAAVVRRLVRLSGIRRVGQARSALAVAANFLMAYLKFSIMLQQAQPLSESLVNQLLYSLCAAASILVLLILFESYQAAQERQRALEVEQMTRRYELRSAQHALEAGDDLRRVYHDMKNHLLAIRALGQDRQAVSEYVDSLLNDLSGYGVLVSTGLSAMDAFLSEKLRRAELEGVRCSLCLDLYPLAFLAPADLIAIFGNAFDNALEAVSQLPEREERIIFLKSSRFANTLLLRFTNRYAGDLRRRDGRLVTRKDEPELHGIGLKSISRAAQRCGGAMDVEIDEAEKTFSLTVLLPLPEAPQGDHPVS